MFVIFFFVFFSVQLQQQGRRDRVQRDDAAGVGERGAGRPPDTQTLADRRHRVGVRHGTAAARQRYVERHVRDRVQAGQPTVGRERVPDGRQLVRVVERHPLPMPVARAVRRPRQSGAPGECTPQYRAFVLSRVIRRPLVYISLYIYI